MTPWRIEALAFVRFRILDIQRSTPKFHAAPSSWSQRHICLKLTSITFCVTPPLRFTISFQIETSEFCWKSIQSFNVWFFVNAFSNFAGIKTTSGTPPSVTSSCIVWVSAPRCRGPRRTLMGQDGQAGGDPIFSAKTYYQYPSQPTFPSFIEGLKPSSFMVLGPKGIVQCQIIWGMNGRRWVSFVTIYFSINFFCWANGSLMDWVGGLGQTINH